MWIRRRRSSRARSYFLPASSGTPQKPSAMQTSTVSASMWRWKSSPILTTLNLRITSETARSVQMSLAAHAVSRFPDIHAARYRHSADIGSTGKTGRAQCLSRPNRKLVRSLTSGKQRVSRRSNGRNWTRCPKRNRAWGRRTVLTLLLRGQKLSSAPLLSGAVGRARRRCCLRSSICQASGIQLFG